MPDERAGDPTSFDPERIAERYWEVVAEVLLLDQGTAAARARAELGLDPFHPSLAGEFRHGSYRK